MTAARLVAIGIIYLGCAMAWFILGGTVVSRSGESDAALAAEVARLWGGRHTQIAPTAWVEVPRVVVEELPPTVARGPAAARGEDGGRPRRRRRPRPAAWTSTLDLDQRRKGLLWYDTYGVAFDGEYRFRNPHDVAAPHRRLVRVPVRRKASTTTSPSSSTARRRRPSPTSRRDSSAAADLGPGQETVLRVRYQLARPRRLDLRLHRQRASPRSATSSSSMKTDFDRIDFPAGTLSPTTRAPPGRRAGTSTWRFASLVTGQRIGMDAPNRLNPGPLAARITFFAPVSLLFFITVMVILGAIRGQSLHPMHYFFVSAAFFAFHLLLAYLVDHVDIHAAFVIAAATSLFLVISYLRAGGGQPFALSRRARRSSCSSSSSATRSSSRDTRGSPSPWAP